MAAVDDFFFAAGEASAEALDDFFVVVVELFFVDEVLAGAAAIGCSFFCASSVLQAFKNAIAAIAVIKLKTVVFIGVVKLKESRECRSAPCRASLKMGNQGPIFSFILKP